VAPGFLSHRSVSASRAMAAAELRPMSVANAAMSSAARSESLSIRVMCDRAETRRGRAGSRPADRSMILRNCHSAPCLASRPRLEHGPTAGATAPDLARLGEVAEWSNAPHSKCGIGASLSGVRIPPSPPNLSEGALFYPMAASLSMKRCFRTCRPRISSSRRRKSSIVPCCSASARRSVRRAAALS
jgi:hypothetical protein